MEFYAVRLNMQSDTDVDDPLEMLFRAHYARLVRALTLVSGSREMAADAVQEAFVKAHLHWWRIKRYDDPIGWIRRVGATGLWESLRRNRHRGGRSPGSPVRVQVWRALRPRPLRLPAEFADRQPTAKFRHRDRDHG